MANLNFRNGLRVAKTKGNDVPFTQAYSVTAQFAVTMYPGDLVNVGTDGYAIHLAAGDMVTTQVGNTMLAVVAGYLDEAPGTGATVDVIPVDSGVQFEVLLSTTDADTAQLRIGDRVSFVGNGGSGRPLVNQSTVAAVTAATGIARVVRFGGVVGQSNTIANPVVIVDFQPYVATRDNN